MVDVQKMETVEQLEPYTCVSLSRLSYFPRGLVEINPINNFRCLFEIDAVKLLLYVYDNCSSQHTKCEFLAWCILYKGTYTFFIFCTFYAICETINTANCSILTKSNPWPLIHTQLKLYHVAFREAVPNDAGPLNGRLWKQ